MRRGADHVADRTPREGRAAVAFLRPLRHRADYCCCPFERAVPRNLPGNGARARVPTAVLSVALVIVGVLCIFAGLILDMTAKTRREMKRLIYLSLPTFKEQ
jgi:hypothetical protein